MKKLIATSILSLLVGSSTFAQQEITKKCGAYEAMEEVFQMYPEIRDSYEAHMLLENSRVKNTNNESKVVGDAYIIPVVFHIIHEYGNENISDAQVYDELEVLNREFNSADPDSVDVVAEFAGLIGNAHMTFKLAALDPYGNCTNGIEHIYSHESRVGDAYSKLNQWNRAKYLNIWVTKIVGQPGAAAYALKPASTDGSGFWMDGIVSNHTYVGSIGTGSPFVESTLSHEIGHYFNLSHTWGNTNDPGVACGDDGVSDTPETAGWTSCPLGSSDNCNTGIQENLQNYMEYAYCDRHFTPGQVEFMHNALEGIAGQRNILWQDSTLIATGVKDLNLPQVPTNDINNLTVPLCVPVADFNADKKAVCVGTSVQFSDESWNAVVASRTWTFEGGTPATSTSANPVVSWADYGWKKVTLVVTNDAGSDTKTEQSYLYVSPDWADYTGPVNFNMESNNHLFLVQNIEDNYGKFAPKSGVGMDGSTAFKLQTYKNTTGADAYTNDWFYNGRLGLSTDNLITPSVDLRNTSSITVSFDYAYATNATQTADITEVLKVYSSRDCGQTWSTRATITGNELVTAGYASNSDFNPTSNTMYVNKSFSYPATSQDNTTRFKFEFVASDVSSNLFIDNININGTLGLNSTTISDLELVVYPNPTQGEAINVSYTASEEPTTFTLRDVQGKVIATQTIETTNASVTEKLNNTQNLPAACYFLEVTTGDYSTTKKVVVM